MKFQLYDILHLEKNAAKYTFHCKNRCRCSRKRATLKLPKISQHFGLRICFRQNLAELCLFFSACPPISEARHAVRRRPVELSNVCPWSKCDSRSRVAASSSIFLIAQYRHWPPSHHMLVKPFKIVFVLIQQKINQRNRTLPLPRLGQIAVEPNS